jgi:tungstate transport system substrate-binding protein
MTRWALLSCFVLALLVGCGTPTTPTSGVTAPPASTAPAERATPPTAVTAASAPVPATTLRLATTTSTADTGLLDAILPNFEERYHTDVQVIAVGTGQALTLGQNGDVDVVLVHARQREDEFVANAFGINRQDVMYNDFVIVGPDADPANIADAADAAEVFRRIADTESTFASRGDDSGTFTKEQSLWVTAEVTPTAELGWYKSLGQGMGETLTTANELAAYTLSDRGTFLSMRDALPNLRIRFGGDTIEQNPDPALRNSYGLIAVNPERHAGINADGAAQFVAWITSPEVQRQIGAFGQDRFGQPLFYPAAP